MAYVLPCAADAGNGWRPCAEVTRSKRRRLRDRRVAVRHSQRHTLFLRHYLDMVSHVPHGAESVPLNADADEFIPGVNAVLPKLLVSDMHQDAVWLDLLATGDDGIRIGESVSDSRWELIACCKRREIGETMVAELLPVEVHAQQKMLLATIDTNLLLESASGGSGSKLWGRRRPSAKARRRRRSIALADGLHEIPEVEASGGAEHGEQQVGEPRLSVEISPPEVVLDHWEMILPMFTSDSYNHGIDGDYAFYNGSSTWPARLVRDVFLFRLPANPDLIEKIDENMFAGSAYRPDECIPTVPRTLAREMECDEQGSLLLPMSNEMNEDDDDEEDEGDLNSEEHSSQSSGRRTEAVRTPRTLEIPEILIWFEVTIRLANQAAIAAFESGEDPPSCLERRMAVVQQRWGEARPNIRESMRDGIWNMLCERPESMREW